MQINSYMNFDDLANKLILEARKQRPSDELILKTYKERPNISYVSKILGAGKTYIRKKLEELGVSVSLNVPKKNFDGGELNLPVFQPKPRVKQKEGVPLADLGISDEELLNLYKQHKNVSAVARIIGKPQPTVYRRIKKVLGQPIESSFIPVRSKLGGKTDEELLNLANKYDSIRNLATRLNVPQPTLYNRLRNLGFVSKRKHEGTGEFPISDADLVELYKHLNSITAVTERIFPGKGRMKKRVEAKLKQLGQIP